MARKSLLKKLQDRGVLRVAGFYIAFAWLTLQIADVLFPAFDIPDSVLRYVLYAAAAGFPVVCLLSWFFEITPDGVVSEEELEEQDAPRVDHRGLTVATMVVLVLALGTSLYVNFRLSTDEPQEAPTLLRILIADFDNQTGDSLFDGALESALAIGMEGAPFVSAFSRNDAARTATKLKAGSALVEETARLVSVREGLDLVLAGSISNSGQSYTLTQRVVDPVEGEEVARVDATANGKAAVLPAVGSLAAQIREALGDVTLEDGNLAANETLTTTSLVAVQHYTKAQNYAFREENEKAIEFFEKAVEEDPEFSRAYSGWALSALKLGQREKSNELWEQTLAKIGSTSERERYRTLGVYYAVVAGNQRKAIESYESLVEKYPADTIGYNNLGVAYFLAGEFDKSLEVGQIISERFPSNPAFRTNYALYAMYAGDFTVARRESLAVLQETPDYFLAYLPLAMANNADRDFVSARADYAAMGELGARAGSVAGTGLADIALLTGDYAEAVQLLQESMRLDTEAGNANGAARKAIELATALLHLGESDRAQALLDEQPIEGAPVSQLLPTALLYIDMNLAEPAAKIAAQLGQSLQSGRRAAAELITGASALAAEDYVPAVDALNAALEHSDTWLGRFYLGKTYALAGYHAEALGEFDTCLNRLGESTALFLDDVPSFRYHAPLYYWLGRTREALGMSDEARNDLERYLSLRIESDGSELTLDARKRLGVEAPVTGDSI